MKVDSSKKVSGVEPIEKVPTGERSAQAQDRAIADRVSTDEAQKLADQVQMARTRAGGARAAKLSQIEAAVRGGHYRPDPSQIAEQILSAAEVDAKLQALLGR